MQTSNPLSDALRRSISPKTASRGTPAPQPDDGTRLIGAHFPAAVHRQLRALTATEGPQHALPSVRGAQRPVREAAAAADRVALLTSVLGRFRPPSIGRGSTAHGL